MSTITTAYDKIVTELGVVFPDHNQLTNPYNPADNNEQFLRQGWGLAMSSAINTNRQVSCKMSIERTVQIVLSREYYTREFDIGGKDDRIKVLLEDHFSMIEHFESKPDLECTVAKFVYASDGGVQFVFSEKNNFIFIISTYEMEYFEDLT